MDIRQIVYETAVRGNYDLSRKFHGIIDEYNLVTDTDLFSLAESKGIDVRTDDTPFLIFEQLSKEI